MGHTCDQRAQCGQLVGLDQLILGVAQGLQCGGQLGIGLLQLEGALLDTLLQLLVQFDNLLLGFALGGDILHCQHHVFLAIGVKDAGRNFRIQQMPGLVLERRIDAMNLSIATDRFYDALALFGFGPDIEFC